MNLQKSAEIQAEEEKVLPAQTVCDDLLLFATHTCPNCAQAEKLLQNAGLAFTKLLAEENSELAKSLGIRQAPTLVVGKEKITGLGPIRKYINNHKN